MQVSNYDEFNYDYSTYWSNRSYEHKSEEIALTQLLPRSPGGRILDIGGSFGRLIPLYYNNFKQVYIADFSLNTLIKNRERILKEFPNTRLVAANAYFLPFKDNSFDTTLTVRVLHHINEPKQLASEVSRVLSNQGTHIQEIPNKLHLKARIRNLLMGNFKFFNNDPYQQPSQNFEGTESTEAIFLNYTPKFINNAFSEFGFKRVKTREASIFRSELLKKNIPESVLIKLDAIYQKAVSGINFSPSVIHKYIISKKSSNSNLDEILCCPSCKSELKFSTETAICQNCKKKFENISGVWDFRIQ